MSSYTVVKDLILNKLKKKTKQDYVSYSKITTQKYFNNSMHNIAKVLLSDNYYDKEYDCMGSCGNVVILDNDVVLKWNNNPHDKPVLFHELRYQRICSLLHLAPKIYESYEYGPHIYIFMENLFTNKFLPLNVCTIDDKMYDLIAENLNVLHNNYISHGDAHMYNIFYNKYTNKIIFIDFSNTSFHKDNQEAKDKEKYDFDKEFVNENWYNLQNISNKFK